VVVELDVVGAAVDVVVGAAVVVVVVLAVVSGTAAALHEAASSDNASRAKSRRRIPTAGDGRPCRCFRLGVLAISRQAHGPG